MSEKEGLQKLVRYELMYGRQAVEAIRACPVGYLPLGPLERHGDHLPMGLDAIKAHKICCLAAEQIGGVVFPPHHYAGIHQLPPELAVKFTGGWGNIYADDSAKGSLVEVISQSALIGIKVLVLYSGHYPPCQTELSLEISNSFESHETITVIPFDESMVLRGDHAGISETSLMLYLEPDLVKMREIGDVNYMDHGWNENNSPEGATVERGEVEVRRVVEYLQREIDKVYRLKR